MTATKPDERPEQQHSLEQIASPERLDQLMQVVKPNDFIPVVAVGGFTAIAIFWSFVGRIPVTVTGQGVLISPQRVVELQSPIAGQLQFLSVKDNQCVKQGEVLATIKPTELEEQLKLQQVKRQQLIVQAANSNSLASERSQLERVALAATRINLNQRLRDVRALSPVLNDQALSTIKLQRQSLLQRLGDATAMVSTLKQRWQRLQALVMEGGLEQNTLISAEREYRQELQNIQELKAQIGQQDVDATEVKQRYLQNLASVSEIQAQLQELDTRSKRLEQDNSQASDTRKNEIAEVERTIAQTKQQIQQRSQIRSPQSGCILAVNSVIGQVVSPGTRLGTLQTQVKGAAGLSAIAYFEVKDGKRIKPGMKMQITPDTVKRERFGGIVATVKSVSAYPITSTTAATKVGNAELADTLTSKTAKVEVAAELMIERGNINGYKWSSSKGPDLKLTSGTTAAVRVMVEEQAPITFLLPFLREWSGI